MTSEAKKEKNILEITKGENANLAGMEPRCPKCGGASLVLGFEPPITPQDDREDVGPYVYCLDCQNRTYAENWRLADFAQFFRSPAPTPPLDVEAVAEKFFKILTVEVCCECGEPRFPQKQKAGDETKDGWPACVNEECFAYGEQGPISVYRCPISERQREEILSLLRRHIASPAQPEKRDEWVSVDERLPKADSQVPELSERVDFFAPGMIGERRFQRGRIKYGHCWRSATGDGEFDLAEVTHWQPLPAPPQSGKEGAL